jgi:hypothetical protein
VKRHALGLAVSGALAASALGSLATVACAPATQKAPVFASDGEKAEPQKAPAPGEPRRPDAAPGTEVSFAPELGEIGAVRGLAARGEVVGREVSREELRAHLEATFAQHLPPRAIQGTEGLLVALGVVPLTFDYYGALIQLLESELAGLYDPAENTMFIVAGLPFEMRRATLLHELVHALQDQHYTLDGLAVYQDDQTDKQSALSALAEGDATSAMFDAMLKVEGRSALDLPMPILERQLRLSEGRSKKGGTPAILARSMLAPYLDGLRFVHDLRQKGGYAAVDAAWKAPPQTTEQLLHPERYLAREQPIAVAVPAPPDSSWTTVFHDIWGEQSLRLLLEEWAPKEASVAAEGWNGDRVALHQKNDLWAASFAFEMDSPAEAAELGLLLGAKIPGGPRASGACAPLPGTHIPITLEWLGRRVTLLAGPFSRTGPSPDCTASQAWQHPAH